MNRNIKIGIIASTLLFLAVLGFAQYNKTQEESEYKFVMEVERNLAADDRKIFEDRITEYKNKLSSSNDNTEKYDLYLQIGQTEYVLGHLESSKNSFSEAIKINSGQYDSHLGLFQTQVDMQDYTGAEESIKKSIILRPGVADFWKRYIQFKIDRNVSNDEINRIYSDAMKDTTQKGDAANNTDVFTSYATWLEKTGNLLGSIDYWKKAISANPDSKTIYQAEIDRINKELQ